MPVNFVPETKKELIKSKFPLSLVRNNAKHLSSQNGKVIQTSKENTNPNRIIVGDHSSGSKCQKRSLSSTYHNTLLAAKKLKPLSEKPRSRVETQDLEIIDSPLPKSRLNSAMLNGHHPSDSQYGGNAQKKFPIATLSNLGNTCFLNSVLYTLRYAPRFIHNLHHLVSDLASVEQKLGSIRLKSSSLGRSAAGLASSGARSWSSKDLLSLGQSDNNTGKTKIQIATEKLHEVFLSLKASETKSASNDTTPDPFAADAFLAALRDVNSTFEGNSQHDAHELLLCILDNIRETCRALSAKEARLNIHENGDSNGLGRQPSLDGDSKPSLVGLRKSWKKRAEGRARAEPTNDRAVPRAPTRPARDLVTEDFEGTMVVRTTCLECETVTQKSQATYELCVPVGDEELSEDEPFRAACLSSECLRDLNKYWCERCLRYNEARRSVSYSRLPQLLILQLKRFSGGMEKISRHTPTPLLMSCFCDECNERPRHRYTLWAVIMHLGQSLTGGHYVAYVRDGAVSDFHCEREGSGDATTANSGSSFMRTLFNRPRPQPTGCAAKECCVPRQRPDACWLVCDDELVKPLSNEEFEDFLSAEPKMRSAATPYLLFYVKSDVG